MTGWVEILDKETKKNLHGCVNNVSSAGIGIYAPNSLTPGNAVSMTLHFFGVTAMETIKDIDGIVAWSFEHELSSIFGISFLEAVTPDNYPALFEFLEDESEA